MLKRSLALAVLVLPLIFQLGCGDSSSTPTATGNPAPAPAATSSPTPSAAPTKAPVASGLCANGNEPVTRFDIKVFSVVDRNGEIRPFDPKGPFYVGETVRFDSQGHDRFGRRTEGCSEPRWDWGPDELAMLSTDKGWNPRAKVLSDGEFFVDANHDHIKADFPLILKFESYLPPPPKTD
jgi:hypothetical protein